MKNQQTNNNNNEMFEDFEMESEYTGAKKISFAKVVSNNQNNQTSNNHAQKTNSNVINTNQSNKDKNIKITNNSKREEKINYYKNIVSEYIKDKELNMYYIFNKLVSLIELWSPTLTVKRRMSSSIKQSPTLKILSRRR